VITKICLHLIYHTELQNFLIAPRISNTAAWTFAQFNDVNAPDLMYMINPVAPTP